MQVGDILKMTVSNFFRQQQCYAIVVEKDGKVMT